MDNKLYHNLLEFDYLDSKTREKIRSQLLFKLFKHAANHEFSKRRLTVIPQDISVNEIVEYWKMIKPIDSKNHDNYIVEYKNFSLLTPDPSANIVFSSGGSSGIPKMIWLTFDEIMRNTQFHAKGYQLAGINEHDNVATFGLPGMLSSEFTVYHGLAKTGCTILPIGSVEDSATVVHLIQKLKATVLLVMPSDLVPIIDYLEKNQIILSQIRLIVTGGEALTNLQRMNITKVIGSNNLIFRSTFQTSDVGTIGFQCPACDANEYHIHEELQYLELIPYEFHDDSMEIVTTNLDRYLMPAIKIKTGDLAQWSSASCSCGRQSRKIRLLGRTNRYKKIGGEKFDTSVFELLPSYMNIRYEDLSIKIERNARQQDVITLYLPSQYSNDKKTQDRIEHFIFSKSPKLQRQIQAGLVSEIKFKNLSVKDIKHSPSGKRIFVIDTRVYE